MGSLSKRFMRFYWEPLLRTLEHVTKTLWPYEKVKTTS